MSANQEAAPGLGLSFAGFTKAVDEIDPVAAYNEYLGQLAKRNAELIGVDADTLHEMGPKQAAAALIKTVGHGTIAASSSQH